MDIKNILLFIIFLSCSLIACFSPQKQDIHASLFDTKNSASNVVQRSSDTLADSLAWDNFLQSFNQAIENNTDRKPLANLCRFPFDFIETQEEFLINFETYFSTTLLEKISLADKSQWKNTGVLVIELATYRYNFFTHKRGNKYYLVDITMEKKAVY